MEGEPVTTQPGAGDAYDYGLSSAPKPMAGGQKKYSDTEDIR